MIRPDWCFPDKARLVFSSIQHFEVQHRLLLVCFKFSSKSYMSLRTSDDDKDVTWFDILCDISMHTVVDFLINLCFAFCLYPSTKSQGQFHKRWATQINTTKLDAVNLIAAHVLFPLPQTNFHNTLLVSLTVGSPKNHQKPNMEMRKITLPETNMALENTPLEKEIPIGNHHFWVQTVSFREGLWSIHLHDEMGSKCDVFSSSVRFLVLFVVILLFSVAGLVRSLEHVASNLTWVKMGGDYPRYDWGRCCLKIYRYSILLIYSYIHSFNGGCVFVYCGDLERIPKYRFDWDI